jgi:hypothetical protein
MTVDEMSLDEMTCYPENYEYFIQSKKFKYWDNHKLNTRPFDIRSLDVFTKLFLK